MPKLKEIPQPLKQSPLMMEKDTKIYENHLDYMSLQFDKLFINGRNFGVMASPSRNGRP